MVPAVAALHPDGFHAASMQTLACARHMREAAHSSNGVCMNAHLASQNRPK